MFCLDFFIILATAARSAAVARRKGRSGLAFGVLHAVVAAIAESAGVMVGLWVGLKMDPFLNKNNAAGPLLSGAAGGLVVGVALMFIVVGLLPDEERGARPRGFRPLVVPEPDSAP